MAFDPEEAGLITVMKAVAVLPFCTVRVVGRTEDTTRGASAENSVTSLLSSRAARALSAGSLVSTPLTSPGAAIPQA